MQILIKPSKDANRIRKQKAHREHVKFHVERAQALKNAADNFYNEGLISKNDRDIAYSEAIAYENAKCLDRH